MGAGLAAAACAPLAPAGSPRPSGAALRRSPPEDVGVSSAALSGIRTALQRQIDANEITGAVTAVARRGRLIWLEAQGVRDTQTQAAMREDDIFRMMSSTKPLTAVAVLMMLEEGRLSLDDEVARFIPEFADQRVVSLPAGSNDPAQATFVPATRRIRIRDLLTHTSGLMSYGDFLAPGPGQIVTPIEHRPGDTLASYVPRLGGVALDFQPGARWRYSPLAGFDTLLRIVEIASGQTADVFLRERVFEPLDMRDTAFNIPEEKRDRLLKLYARKNDSWVEEPSILGPEDHRAYLSGAGGLFSTALDYLKFEMMLTQGGAWNGRRLLKTETVALMSTNQVGQMFSEWIPPITAGMGFGLSVSVVEDESKGDGRSKGAFGWGGAYGTETWADPALEVSACLMVQQGSRSAKAALSQAIRAAITA
ncbi:serine hydrolase domain-containing protein [Brevundimonas intermedia]|uniref:serine hydrolase domain-containing protein n=1 Tax=Brevundimonas intermedia TaxID=74315 RepID=UPI0032098F61